MTILFNYIYWYIKIFVSKDLYTLNLVSYNNEVKIQNPLKNELPIIEG